MTAPLSIALADDQALIRSALAALLHELRRQRSLLLRQTLLLHSNKRLWDGTG